MDDIQQMYRKLAERKRRQEAWGFVGVIILPWILVAAFFAAAELYW